MTECWNLIVKLPKKYGTFPTLPPLNIEFGSENQLILRRIPNNAFVNEFCIECSNWFDASRTHIWRIDKKGGNQLGYVCYMCGEKLAKANKKVRITFS